jgi:DNA-binding LacI/PurR family transcriptional regulator
VGRVTIADVARRARVSPASVSAAFNDPAQLSSATVSRIRDAARRLGYAPNPHARALHSRRAGVLGVLFPQAVATIFANPFFSAFLEGVGCVTDERGIGLLTASPSHGSLGRAIDAAPVDGFVIVGLDERHDEVAPLRKRGVPFVIVDGDAEAASSVNVDDEAGAYRAARYLVDRGHRDILVLGFEMPREDMRAPRGVAGRRLAGYRRACLEAGIALGADAIRRTPVSIAGGDDAFTAAYRAGRRPTAVLAVSDIIAIGAVRAARALGMRVPDDVEFIGFDDVPLASASSPALSTIHQPIGDKGRAATRLLLRELDGSELREHLVLPTALVLRDTTSDLHRGDALRREKGGSYRGRRTLMRAAAD